MWDAALSVTQGDKLEPGIQEMITPIDLNILQRAKRTDTVRGDNLRMKDSSQMLIDYMKQNVRGPARKMIHEETRLRIEDGVL